MELKREATNMTNTVDIIDILFNTEEVPVIDRTAEINKAISNQIAIINDWKSRIYKENTKAVIGSEKNGGVPSYSVSIGRANENKRNNVIKNAFANIANLKAWIDNYSADIVDDSIVAFYETATMNDLAECSPF